MGGSEEGEGELLDASTESGLGGGAIENPGGTLSHSFQLRPLTENWFSRKSLTTDMDNGHPTICTNNVSKKG